MSDIFVCSLEGDNMPKIPLQPGWLRRQFARVTLDIAAWPESMRKEAGFEMPTKKEIKRAQDVLSSDKTPGKHKITFSKQ